MKFSLSGTMNLSWGECREAARLAEQLGFDEFYASDHLMAVAGFDAEKGLLDAIGLLLALAPVTERIRLGCLVSPVTFRNPVVLLRQIQTLDVVSEGRAILGLGAGWSATEHKAFNIPFPRIGERLSMLEDACRFAREAWAGLRPRPPQGRVRLLVAGASPRVIKIAARHADAWHAIGTPALIAERIGALRAAERDAGRTAPTEATVNLIARLSDDEAELESLRRALAAASASPSDERAQARVALPAESGEPPVFVGRPSRLRDEIDRYSQAGVDRVILALPRPFSAQGLAELAHAAGVGG